MAQEFNTLLDTPPDTIQVGGREYQIETDFRAVLSYMRLARSDDNDREKAYWTMNIFFGEQEIEPENVLGLFEGLEWFIRRGDEDKDDGSRKRPVFDILKDSNRIYAAFMQVYTINLRTVRIHWWVFMVLLEGLPKGTHLADVIELRSKKVEAWMKHDDISELKRIQSYYSLTKAIDPMASMGAFMGGLARG
jgi:hypothetical protein